MRVARGLYEGYELKLSRFILNATNTKIPRTRAVSGYFPFSIMMGAQNTPLSHQPLIFSKNASILYIKTPQFNRIMAFRLVLHAVFAYSGAICLKFASLCSFLNRNRNSYRHTNHRVIAGANQTHHLNMSRNG